MLQSCRAASKLVLLDCCPSGSVVQGWTSKGGPDPADRPAPSTLLHPTGVYFTTASDALQAASAKAPEGSLPRHLPVHRRDRGRPAERADQGGRLDHPGRPLRVPGRAQGDQGRPRRTAAHQVHRPGHPFTALRPFGRPSGPTPRRAARHGPGRCLLRPVEGTAVRHPGRRRGRRPAAAAAVLRALPRSPGGGRHAARSRRRPGIRVLLAGPGPGSDPVRDRALLPRTRATAQTRRARVHRPTGSGSRSTGTDFPRSPFPNAGTAVGGRRCGSHPSWSSRWNSPRTRTAATCCARAGFPPCTPVWSPSCSPTTRPPICWPTQRLLLRGPVAGPHRRPQAGPASRSVGAADPAPVLGWVDVPYGESAAGSGGRSWRNQAEADQVRQTVDELLARLPEDATVGVVTPFRAQKKALSRVWAGDDQVRVGTVHAFQGGQRDVMVLSPVATHNTPPRTTHWVASQVNLRNVAVTRAKSQLITVGSHRFWQGQSGLPAPLAGRSTVLRAGTTAERDTTPAPQAPPGFREELADLLHEYLGTRGVTDLERAAVVGATRWTCCSRWTGRTLRCSSTRAPSRAGSRPPPPARPRTRRPPDRAPLRRTRHETRAGDPDGTPAGLASTGRTGATGPTLRLTPGPDGPQLKALCARQKRAACAGGASPPLTHEAATQLLGHDPRPVLGLPQPSQRPAGLPLHSRGTEGHAPTRTSYFVLPGGISCCSVSPRRRWPPAPISKDDWHSS